MTNIETSPDLSRCVAAIRFATKYPLISEKSIAAELGWTTKQLEKKLKSHNLELPNVGFRAESLERTIKVASRLKDGGKTLKKLVEDRNTLRYTGQTGKLRV